MRKRVCETILILLSSFDNNYIHYDYICYDFNYSKKLANIICIKLSKISKDKMEKVIFALFKLILKIINRLRSTIIIGIIIDIIAFIEELIKIFINKN